MSTINLLPEDYIQRRSQHRTNVVCMILLAVVVAGVGAATAVSESNTRNTQQIRDQVNASYEQAATLLAQLRNLEAQKRKKIKKAKATAALLERVPRSYLLAVLTQALPKNASLTEVKLDPKRKILGQNSKLVKKSSKFAAAKGKKKQAPVPQIVVTVEVTGLAATDVEVARFLANLLRNPLLTNVDLGYSQEKVLRARQKDLPDLNVREFQVTMELRENVDVIDLIRAAG